MDETRSGLSAKVAVVIPCFKPGNQLLHVINSIGPEVDMIIIVDDASPKPSVTNLIAQVTDLRLTVLTHIQNQGVGAAMRSGYLEALKMGADYVVKIDSDGQMDPKLIPKFLAPLITGKHDYSKGNRFFNVEDLLKMPKHRIIGNLILSFFCKFSSGYWNIFDPNNGYTAITREKLEEIPLQKVSDRYFFESDMLFRLYLTGASVIDVPMKAQYDDEQSHLRVWKVLFEFPLRHSRNFMKRITYTYFIRDFSLASIELVVGTFLTLFGLIFGLYNFIHSGANNRSTPTGTLILISMCFLSGLQLLLGFFAFDMQSISKFKRASHNQ